LQYFLPVLLTTLVEWIPTLNLSLRVGTYDGYSLTDKHLSRPVAAVVSTKSYAIHHPSSSSSSPAAAAAGLL